jgi:hypothetical protein
MKQMFKKILNLIFLLLSLNLYSIDSIITIFVKKYPYLKKSEIKALQKDFNTLELSNFSKKLKQPDYLHKSILNKYANHIFLPGIVCFYTGRSTTSKPDGQITFPRKQQTADMHILIAEKVIPAYMIAPSTVHNWQIDPTQSAEMYLMELKHDPVSKLSYYETKKTALPKDNKIPLNTLIFIADPKTMYIPLGATIVDNSPNIVLPDIYIKKGFCFLRNALFNLAVNQYFEDTEKTIKQENNVVSEIQQP